MIKAIVAILFSLVLFIGLSASVLDAIYGGGESFPDLTQMPIMDSDTLEVVVDLDYPPGNISVSNEGRIFFTFHPEAKPPVNIAELVDGKVVPLTLPSEVNLTSVLSLRVDRQNRLWLLDFADHGMETPQLVAIDLYTMELVHHFEFPSDIAGMGSHLNDFQVSQDGKFVYIADASILRKNPALIVYNVERKTARRLLEGHDSVKPDYYVPVVENEKMLIFGVFAIRPGVDSIALDRQEKWLYFAPVTDTYLHRIAISDLRNTNLSPEKLTQKVERFAKKSMSDGITTDDAGNIYISDLEHTAINRISAEGKFETLLKDPKLRWPDGFSFGPGGWLYVTNSALNVVIGKPSSYIMEQGPYQILRFKPESSGYPGH
ncbi:MAG: sugar lactone lactonase YvrE [Oleiphilaceae bacterium]|jgi:sugar lactone lactonase YvrE